MTPQSGECVVCCDVITNPVCISCLQIEMEHWLLDRKPAIVSLIRNTTTCFKSYTHDVIKCVICGGNMNVCAHCYSKDVIDFIKKDKELVKEFLIQFNYQLDYSII